MLWKSRGWLLLADATEWIQNISMHLCKSNRTHLSHTLVCQALIHIRQKETPNSYDKCAQGFIVHSTYIEQLYLHWAVLLMVILPRNSTVRLFVSPHWTTKLVSRPSTGPPATVIPVLRRKARFTKRCNASTATTPTRNFKRAWVPCAIPELPLSSLSRVSHKNTVWLRSLLKRKFKSERHLFWVLRTSIWAHNGHNVPASNAQEANNDVFSLMYFFLEFLSVLFCTSSSSLIVFNCCTFCHDSSATSWVFLKLLNRGIL